MAFAIVTNIGFCAMLICYNIYISVQIYSELVSQINQRGGGKLITTLNYIFLTKFSLLAITTLVGGASPFTILCLTALNLAETFLRPNKPKNTIKVKH